MHRLAVEQYLAGSQCQTSQHLLTFRCELERAKTELNLALYISSRCAIGVVREASVEIDDAKRKLIEVTKLIKTFTCVTFLAFLFLFLSNTLLFFSRSSTELLIRILT